MPPAPLGVLRCSSCAADAIYSTPISTKAVERTPTASMIRCEPADARSRIGSGSGMDQETR
jgi:hypothetical protein